MTLGISYNKKNKEIAGDYTPIRPSPVSDKESK